MNLTPGNETGSDDTWWTAHKSGPLQQVTLRDGATVWVGPMLKIDREPLSDWYDTLSPDSKRHRFLGNQEHLDSAMLDVLVDGVDGINHVALVALAEEGGKTHPVGVARVVRMQEPPTAADVAVTVDDAWQGRGLATAMLPILLAHRPEGVVQLRTQVDRDNAASLAMLRRLGVMREVGFDAGIVDLEIQLPWT